MTATLLKGNVVLVLLNIDKKSKTPVFRQIFCQIKSFIENNNLIPGERLPSTRTLAEKLDVHRSTVYKAYEELWAMGYLESRPGSYTTVRKKPSCVTLAQKSPKGAIEWAQVASRASDTIFHAHLNMRARSMTENHSDLIDFSTLDLDSRHFPVEDFRKCINRVLIDKGPELFKYGVFEGYRPLREYIAQRLRVHSISVTAEEILITNGAQNGFDLVMKLMASPGCRVLVESPTYALVLPIFDFYRTRVVGIPMEKTGINLRHLESELKKELSAFVYTIPNFQNPTGITMTQAHREELLWLCESYNVPIVEDAFEEEMKYFGKVPLPIKSMDRNQIVIYLGTFSKVLAPGIRIGWVAAEKECIARLAALKRFSDLSTSTPIQAALAEFCRQGGYDLHIKRMHRVYRKRMQIAIEAMKKYINHKRVIWKEPTGGYLLWFELKNSPIEEQLLYGHFLDNGVKVAIGNVFFPQKTKHRYIRLSISTLDEEEIIEGIRRVGRTISQITGK